MVKALDLSSNGRVVRVGSNPTPGKKFSFNSRVKCCLPVPNLRRPRNIEFTTVIILNFNNNNNHHHHHHHNNNNNENNNTNINNNDYDGLLTE